MRDDDTDIEALPASVSFRFVSYDNTMCAHNVNLNKTDSLNVNDLKHGAKTCFKEKKIAQVCANNKLITRK